MASYRTRQIEDLALQLHRAPRRLCLRHLLNIDFALSVVETHKHYPADFAWHAVTGVRPGLDHREPKDPVLLRGDDLRQDLVMLAERLSGSADLPAAACPQPVSSAAELARRFDVSLKTIARWRKRGLVAWKLAGPDGRKRIVFPDRSVRRFVAEDPGLIRRAASFSHLSDREHAQIVKRVQTLLADSRSTVNSVAEQVAAETGRGRETIRLILKRHDEGHPQHPLPKQHALPVDGEAQRLQVWEAYQDGTTLDALAERFGKPAAAIYRTVTRMRAYDIKSRPIEHIRSPEFSSPTADADILQDPAAEAPFAKPPARQRLPENLPPYLRELFQVPLLTRAGEYALFRQMNYLKWRAEALRAQLVPETATARELDQIEALLNHADQIRGRITRSNLRLVVHIAKRHASPRHDLFELVSDGNVALLRAVDLFDFTRGYKLSTYASWAIMRQLARQTSDAHKHQTRYQTGLQEIWESMSASVAESEPALAARELLEHMSASLSQRQWFILRNRFGLVPNGDPQTLAQLGEQLGVSKERVRQIEAQAIARLQRRFGRQFGRL